MSTKPTRNSEVLGDFVRYCQEHPEERFYQALRNWSGKRFIFAHDECCGEHDQGHDTFYWETKDGRECP